MTQQINQMKQLAEALIRLPDQQVVMDPDLEPNEASIRVGLELWKFVLREKFELTGEG